MATEKITENIYMVGGSSYSDSSDAAVYLIKSEDEAALIDTGTGEGVNYIIDNIKSIPLDPALIKYIFLTHCHFDHTGGANKLRELTGAKLVAHKLAALYLEAGDSEVTAASWYGAFMKPTKIDIKVKVKKKIFQLGELKIVLMHTPGHSPGSSVLTVESEGKFVLFGQDVHGPLDDMLLSNRSDYKASLKYLLTLNADILCEGHYGIYKGKEDIKLFIESFL
jgi:glyoxylase-like metal-dependent hydrolase (beta-lactamase superfamily II)